MAMVEIAPVLSDILAAEVWTSLEYSVSVMETRQSMNVVNAEMRLRPESSFKT